MPACPLALQRAHRFRHKLRAPSSVVVRFQCHRFVSNSYRDTSASARCFPTRAYHDARRSTSLLSAKGTAWRIRLISLFQESTSSSIHASSLPPCLPTPRRFATHDVAHEGQLMESYSKPIQDFEKVEGDNSIPSPIGTFTRDTNANGSLKGLPEAAAFHMERAHSVCHDLAVEQDTPASNMPREWILGRMKDGMDDFEQKRQRRSRRARQLRQIEGHRTTWPQLVSVFQQQFGASSSSPRPVHGHSETTGVDGKSNAESAGAVPNPSSTEQPGSSQLIKKFAILTGLDALPRHDCYAHQVAVPKHWTSSSLFAYVRAIVRSRPRIEMSTRRTHNKHIAVEILMHVLDSKSTARPAFSEEVFYMAFLFVLKHHRYREARQLLSIMDEVGLPVTMRFYNRLLRRQAKRLYLDFYRDDLLQIARRGLEVNAETWLTLFPAAPDARSQQVLFHKIKDMLHPSDRNLARDSSALLVAYSFKSYLAAGGNLEGFLQACDNIYCRTDWISPDGLHQMLKGLGETGLFKEALDLIDISSARTGEEFRIQDLNTLLGVCARAAFPEMAIDLTVQSLLRWHARLDSLSYAMLFSIAYKKGWFNLGRVVWIYAGCRAMITRYMSLVVRNSILRQTSPELPNMESYSNPMFGLPICGEDPKNLPTLAELNDLMMREKTMFHRWKTTLPFSTILMRAFHADMHREREGALEERGSLWPPEHHVAVPLLNRLEDSMYSQESDDVDIQEEKEKQLEKASEVGQALISDAELHRLPQALEGKESPQSITHAESDSMATTTGRVENAREAYSQQIPLDGIDNLETVEQGLRAVQLRRWGLANILLPLPRWAKKRRL